MKIIIGLGNPGKQYENTRHNIGFEVIDKLKEHFDFPEFSFNKKFNAEISEGNYADQKLVLAKPQTFMNLSGTSARALLDFYKITPDDLIVIQDEADIAVGSFKISTDSRSAGHNGIQNIIDNLGTQKFARLRIGIGKTTTETPSCRIGIHDFVLGKFSHEESEKINQVFEVMIEAIEKLL